MLYPAITKKVNPLQIATVPSYTALANIEDIMLQTTSTAAMPANIDPANKKGGNNQRCLGMA